MSSATAQPLAVTPPTGTDCEELVRDLEADVRYGHALCELSGYPLDADDEKRADLEEGMVDARSLADRLDEHAPAIAAEYARPLRDLADRAQRILEGPRDDEAADGEEPKGKGKPSIAQILVRLASRAELFRTPAGDLYATFPVGEHRETWPLRAAEFRNWLALTYYDRTSKPPSPSTVATALGVLEAKARFGDREREVHTRLAAYADGTIYVDLCDASWSAIEITSEGWAVVATPPIRFRRAKGQRPIPKPARAGDLDALRRYINVGSDDDFRLIVAWLLAALRPTGPYPVLVLHGEQGSAKSSATRYLRQLVDPNAAPTRDAPKTAQDLAVMAKHSRVLALDNLSKINTDLSDALCRIATGGGFATRELYTDDSEVIFYEQRPVVLNGIIEVATRGDLLSRSLVIRLPALDSTRRRTEHELDRAFERDRPAILAALLDASSTALRRHEHVQLDRTPRMADFARWTEAAAPALGWPAGHFLDIYSHNRDQAVDVELDASPIGGALLALAAAVGYTWEDTSTKLLTELATRVDPDVRAGRTWPRSSRGLTEALRRLAPALRARGVVVTEVRAGKQRTRRVRVERVDTTPTTDAPPTLLTTSD